MRQKPVDVSAAVADVANGSRVCPVEIEEGRHRSIQLSFSLPKAIVFAYLAVQIESRDLNLFRLTLSE